MKFNIAQDEFHKLVLGLNSIKLSHTHLSCPGNIHYTLALATIFGVCMHKIDNIFARSGAISRTTETLLGLFVLN